MGEIKDVIKKAGFNNAEWKILDNDICANMPIIKLIK